MTLSSLFLTAKFEFVIISRHLVVKKESQKSSVPKEFIGKGIFTDDGFSIQLLIKTHDFAGYLSTQAWKLIVT